MKPIQQILLLATGGVLFAGYLTVSKLFLGSCPLTEGCPYFLGLPSCVWGLLMFGIIWIAAFMHGRAAKKETAMLHSVIQWVSGIGILFSGYFSIIELFFPSCAIQPCTYSLILPSCVYGLLMYVLIFIIAWKMKGK